MFNKDTFRLIKRTFKRFMTLLLMVLIGAGFMVGLMSSSPMLQVAVDKYNDDYNLFDIQLYSSFGFDYNDIKAIEEVEGVKEVYASKFTDAYGSLDESTTLVTRVQEYDSSINQFKLIEGSWPKHVTEAVVLQGSEMSGAVKIGDVIEIYYDDDDIKDNLKYSKFKIVGVVEGPEYLAKTYETSTYKNLALQSIIFVDSKTFISDYYTTVFVTVEGAKDEMAYSDAYKAKVTEVKERIEELAITQQEVLKATIIADAQEQIADAEKELEDAKIEAEKEFADAEKELADGQKELNDARQELLDAQKELEDGWKQYYDGLEELEEGKKALAEGWAELEANRKTLEEAEDEVKGKTGMDPSEAYETISKANNSLKTIDANIEPLLKATQDVYLDISNTDDCKALAGVCLIDGGDDEDDSSGDNSEETTPTPEEESYLLLELMLAETHEERKSIKTQICSNIDNEILLNYDEENAGGILFCANKIKDSIANLKDPKLAQLINNMNEVVNISYEDLEDQLTNLERIVDELINAAEDNITQLNTIKELVGDYDGSNPSQILEIVIKVEEYYSDKQSLYILSQRFEGEEETTISDAMNEALEGLNFKGKEYLFELIEKYAGDLSIGTLINNPEKVIAAVSSGIRGVLAHYIEQLDTFEDQLYQLVDGRRQFDQGLRELYEGEEELEEGEKELEEAYEALIEGEAELKDGWNQYYDGVNDLKKGRSDLEEAKDEYEKEIEEAEADIAKARQDLADLPEAEWMILDRDSNYSHALFDATLDQMGSIGNVFPLLFFLVAALVCLTTMTRLIDEERGQIGVFSALGFSKNKIISKYLIYAFVASIFGAIIGIPIGMLIYPTIIYNTWKLMYYLPDMMMYAPPLVLILGIFSFATLMMAVTYFVAKKTLKEKPAELMRPKAPKAGKTIFLEKIRFIWKKLSFLTKINARNIFRYKSRLFMTVIGVAGCTSLLVLGFGIKDSIGDIIDIQYGEIFVYNETISLEDDTYFNDLYDALNKDSNVDEVVGYLEYSSKVYIEDEPTITVEVFNSDEIDRVIHLRDRGSGENLTLNDGVIISEKFASSNGISVGDYITIESEGGLRAEVRVDDICELYFSHYLFMDAESYHELFIERASFDKLAVISKDAEALKEDYEVYDGVEAIVDFSGVIDNFQSMISALDLIVLVIIVAAGSLALVVLINLSEVNISERVREIATFKVLGFYDREVNSYIFRELLILTVIGGIVGMPLGKIEHTFVMKIIDMEMIMFGSNISLPSYLYSFTITILFTLIVLVVMSKSIKKVKMVESLKSVE